MKTTAVALGALTIIGLCLWSLAAIYMNYSQSWQADHEKAAIRDFSNRREQYEGLLRGWFTLFPAKCGSGSTPGFVNFESLTEEQDGRFSWATHDARYAGLSVDELAKRLEAKPEVVRSTIVSLHLVGSPEILQSGEEVKIISPENDTHGYLSVDQSCPGAPTTAFWSEQPDNSKPDNPGEYLGSKSLGNGWYYFVEQR